MLSSAPTTQTDAASRSQPTLRNARISGIAYR